MKKIPDPGLPGMTSDRMANDQRVGFEASTSAYIVKKGTPEGESAHFNAMPPGMNIEDQVVADIRPMPMKKLTSESYPGDGW